MEGETTPILTGEEGETQQVVEASKLMLISTRTAPKTAGVDDVLTALVTGGEKLALAADMERVGSDRKNDTAGFVRDARNVRDSAAVLLVGVRAAKNAGLNCGSCGYADCNEFNKAERRRGNDFVGPSCALKLLDLGIALGSAVKTASILNLDNRVMYRIGVSAMRLNLLPGADIIIGVPVSARGKSIYFDRKT